MNSKRSSIIAYWVDDNVEKIQGIVDRFIYLFQKEIKRKVLNRQFSDPEMFLKELISGKLKKPQLIIIDILMPKLDGIRLMREIRALNKFDDCLIVSSSVLNDPLDNNYLQHIGFDLSFSNFPPEIEIYAKNIKKYMGRIHKIKKTRYSRENYEKLLDDLYDSRMREKNLENNYVKKLIDPKVFETIRENKLDEIKWQRISSSVGFVDIRDFSGYSSKLQPEDLSILLNIYVSQITELIIKNGGSIDKFIGDAVMWTVGAVSDIKEHECINIQIARAIQKDVNIISQKISKKIGTVINMKCGIGLAGGPMDIGMLGQKWSTNSIYGHRTICKSCFTFSIVSKRR